jgi:parallel beta-helix repeat protein
VTSSTTRRLEYFVLAIIIATGFLGFALPSGGSESEVSIRRPEMKSVYSYNIQTGPIVIGSNEDFSDYAQYGTGVKSNPFVLQFLNISAEDVCIRISNTRSYFIIRNCVLLSNYTAWEEASITLDDVENGRIENCRFEQGTNAIAANRVSNCNIINNEFGTNRIAVVLQSSTDAIIAGNTQIANSIQYPIHVADSERIQIKNNLFHRIGSEGVRISSGIDCLIQNNTAIVSPVSVYTLHGFGLVDSFGCRVINNFAQGFARGVDIRNGGENVVSDNEILTCISGIRVVGNNSRIINNAIMAYFHGVEIRSGYNCEVRDNDIRTTWGDSIGIEIAGGAFNFVNYNSVRNAFKGARLQGTENSVFSSNEIINCTAGISLEEISYFDVPWGPPIDCELSENVLVGCSFAFDLYSSDGFSHEMEGNTINGEPFGYFYNSSDEIIDGQTYGQIILANCFDVELINTHLEGQSTAISVLFSEKIEIDSAIVRNNEYGIRIRGSREVILNSIISEGNELAVNIEDSESCYIYKSDIERNFYGLLIEDSDRFTIYGCSIYENYLSAVIVGCDESVIENNAIEGNDYGLHLFRTDRCYVVGNHLLNNSETGILINRGSEENHIYRNYIGYNGVNAICYGTLNQFDDGVNQGNYWSGISYADKVYTIDADDVDRFPKVLPGSTTMPVIVVETENEYSLLNDPLFTIFCGAAACGVTLLMLRSRKLL